MNMICIFKCVQDPYAKEVDYNYSAYVVLLKMVDLFTGIKKIGKHE
jgi:hypothetical protein